MASTDPFLPPWLMDPRVRSLLLGQFRSGLAIALEREAKNMRRLAALGSGIGPAVKAETAAPVARCESCDFVETRNGVVCLVCLRSRGPVMKHVDLERYVDGEWGDNG